MSRLMKAFVCSVVLPTAIGLSACSNSNGAPTGPSGGNNPPPATTNRNPTISSAIVNPAAGYASFTSHSFSASATDPDGDPLTFVWDFGNNTSSPNANAAVTYNNGTTTTYPARVTVTDSRGGSATTTVPVTSAAMGGQFSGEFFVGTMMRVSLTQFVGGVVTGTWEVPEVGFVGDVGPTGEPGKIQPNGQFELRFKVRVGAFADFYFRGSLSADGQQLVGTLHQSGFAGESLILRR